MELNMTCISSQKMRDSDRPKRKPTESAINLIGSRDFIGEGMKRNNGGRKNELDS
jgi:hypothetical protein